VRRLLVVALVTAAYGLIVPNALAVTVSSLEVTQAIQTPTNSIKLIARRSTAVRATLATGGGAVAGVNGSLHVIRNGVDVTPAGIAPINALMTAPAAPQRANESDTLNFEFTGATATSVLTPSTNVVFRVDVTPGPVPARPRRSRSSTRRRRRCSSLASTTPPAGWGFLL
jgi:hypothetical protein